jgi:hypothetical protein
MAYFYTRFTSSAGTIWLPYRDPVDPADMGGYTSKTVPLSGGGVFDPAGDERLPRGQRSLSRKGLLLLDDRTAWQTAYDALAVASGLRGRIWRQNETGNRADWARARLMVDPEDRTPEIVRARDGYWGLVVTTTIEVQDPIWHGLRHGTALAPLDSGIGLDDSVSLDDTADTYALTASPVTLTYNNDGNAEVDDIVVTVVPLGSALTALTLQVGRAKVSMPTLNIPVGNSLIFDSGNSLVAHQTQLTAPASPGATSLAVTNAAGTGMAAGNRIRIVLDDGTTWEGTIATASGTTITLVTGLPWSAASGREVWVAAYGPSGFARDSVFHAIPAWLRLLPGSNGLIVTKTGGNSSSTFSLFYYDGWR